LINRTRRSAFAGIDQLTGKLQSKSKVCQLLDSRACIEKVLPFPPCTFSLVPITADSQSREGLNLAKKITFKFYTPPN
jgi:hypothetical protein